jgi:DNA-binding response OmpR family regulator
MPPHALIVDDDAPIRIMLATIVEQQGFVVDTAKDGGEAIQKIATQHYDVVLLDLMMPRVDGYDVLQWMRTSKPELLRATIVATAVPEREVIRHLKDPVYKVHLKPFELPRLLADIRSCAVA